jgi:hypothetical protein
MTRALPLALAFVAMLTMPALADSAIGAAKPKSSFETVTKSSSILEALFELPFGEEAYQVRPGSTTQPDLGGDQDGRANFRKRRIAAKAPRTIPRVARRVRHRVRLGRFTT